MASDSREELVAQSSIARTIEILTVPHGDAPAWVRAGWVGCRFPTASLECGHIPEYVHSVLSSERKGMMPAREYLALSQEEREKMTLKIAGFSVRQDIALHVLEKRDAKAARWWRDHGFPKESEDENCFRFKREEVIVVDTFTHEELAGKKMTIYDDMETGTMRPAL